jgi:hypothetical protein
VSVRMFSLQSYSVDLIKYDISDPCQTLLIECGIDEIKTLRYVKLEPSFVMFLK